MGATVHVEPVIVLGCESDGLSVVGVSGLQGSPPEHALMQVSADGAYAAHPRRPQRYIDSWRSTPTRVVAADRQYAAAASDHRRRL